MKRRRIFLSLLAMLLVLLAGCAAGTEESTPITEVGQLDGQTIGVMTGSTFDQHTDTYDQHIPW